MYRFTQRRSKTKIYYLKDIQPVKVKIHKQGRILKCKYCDQPFESSKNSKYCLLHRDQIYKNMK